MHPVRRQRLMIVIFIVVGASAAAAQSRMPRTTPTSGRNACASASPKASISAKWPSSTTTGSTSAHRYAR